MRRRLHRRYAQRLPPSANAPGDHVPLDPRVERTGPNTANITGDLTLLGVTKPVTLEARFNGGYEGMPVYDPNGRVGFSAHGSFNRSEFGMTLMVCRRKAPISASAIGSIW